MNNFNKRKYKNRNNINNKQINEFTEFHKQNINIGQCIDNTPDGNIGHWRGVADCLLLAHATPPKHYIRAGVPCADTPERRHTPFSTKVALVLELVPFRILGTLVLSFWRT